jgi:hypothetical protein
MPLCDGKRCGPDQCGGGCGACDAEEVCDEGQCVAAPGDPSECPHYSSPDGDFCVCEEGYVPNADFTGCVPLGGDCGNVTRYGHCIDERTWVRCDSNEGVVQVGCSSQCATVTADGIGACTCDGIDANGICGGAKGESGREVHYFCLENLGILVADNCREVTGSSTGLCTTYVSEFGYQTSCQCGPCSIFLSGRCVAACSGVCRYSSSPNTYTCT